MSDSATVLVGTSERPHAVAAAVIALLCEREIIEPMPTDSALGGLGHRPGKKWKTAVEPMPGGSLDLWRLRTNGVEVESGVRKKLYISPEGDELVIRCPNCRAAIDEPYEHLEPPNAFEPPKAVACASCKTSRPIDEWNVENGAFGNVALSFWNWPTLSPKLIGDIEKACGASMTVVEMHI